MTPRNAAVTTRNDRPHMPLAALEGLVARDRQEMHPGPGDHPCGVVPEAPLAAGVRQRRSYLELEARASSAPQARRHVRSTLARWGLSQCGLSQVADDAELIAGELIANAIAASAGLPFPAWVGLAISACPARLSVLVWDASGDRPVRRPHDDDAVTGRGLGIVAALSTRWGWTSDVRGKVVWASIDLECP
jgi:anti-sigma regulatory factor (Ser/Thr protein kinase)